MRRGLWIGGALVTFPIVVLGCSTILGIGPLDAGPAKPDASVADVVVDDAAETPEASPPADEGPPEAACTPVVVKEAGIVDVHTCKNDDASCPLQPVPASALYPWVTPKPQKVCTTSDISVFINACILNNAGPNACEDFEVAHADCVACIVTPLDNGNKPRGPIVTGTIGNMPFVVANFGGCIALLDPCNEACGKSVLSLSECQFAACSNACAAGATCTDNAGVCPCQEFGLAESTCVAQLVAEDSPASVCVPGAGDTAGLIFERIIPPFCASE